MALITSGCAGQVATYTAGDVGSALVHSHEVYAYSGTAMLTFWENVGSVVTYVFWMDLLLTFFTGYDKGFEVVMEKKEIAIHYLTGWFLIDFIATVEW